MAPIDHAAFDAAIAAGRRERPEVERDVPLLIAAISLVAERRPRIDARFIAHTAVHYHDARRPGEVMDASALADLIVTQWDVETEASMDELRSAGL